MTTRHQGTIDVYEAAAQRYAALRGVQHPERVTAFVDSLPDGGLRLDLGCGPGQYLPLLGRPAIAIDATAAMVGEVWKTTPDVPAVQAELTHLPLATASVAGIWASKAHQHVRAAHLPLALAEAHRVLSADGRLALTVFAPGEAGAPTHEQISDPDSGDDLPGRLFTWWDPGHLATVVDAAGFRVDALEVLAAPPGGHPRIELDATRQRALPDFVGPDLRLLCCGLNPSLHAADAGVGYVTGSNRFWKAMAAAGLATRDRDPRHLLEAHNIGMTDLVKRPTPRAAELSSAEYREGVARLERLCTWLVPRALAVVGLAGWRAGVDRHAVVGWQAEPLGPTPVYVLPSTSGLNAGTSLDDLAHHLLLAAAGP